MNMKRSAWICLGVLCGTTPARAADTASIVLRGYVPLINAIELRDINPVLSLDLRSPVREALVARIVERSNSQAGYTIKLVSENGQRGATAALRNDQVGVTVPYSVSYGGQPVRFTNGRAELVRGALARSERSQERELRISTDGSDRLAMGEYSDTLVISVTAR